MQDAKKIMLATPRGFCAGVERAIEIVERVVERYGAPVYVKHEVVHNTTVVDSLRRRGVRFIEDPAEVPEGAVLIFSAHGVSQAVREAAVARNLKIFDATCPLVTKVHAEIRQLRDDGYFVAMIGHRGHPEVEGTLGQVGDGVALVEVEDDVAALAPPDPKRIAYVTQTTLSVDETRTIIAAIAERFPDVRHPRKDDICYATQNRQDAVKAMAQRCDLILVVGSDNSSNSNRLREVSERAGCEAHLIDSVSDIRAEWLSEKSSVGVTAGASAPEALVEEVVAWLTQSAPQAKVEELKGPVEDMVFSVPKELLRPMADDRRRRV